MAGGQRDVALGGAAAALLLVLSACAQTDEANPADTSTPTPEQESPSPAGPEELALEAYEGLWGAIVNQSHSTDAPDYSEVERYATDQALEVARDNLEERQGEVSRGEPVFSPQVIEVDDDAAMAEIQDCMDSTEWLREDAESGELIEEVPEDPIHRRIEATVEFNGLVWRVSELLVGEIGSC